MDAIQKIIDEGRPDEPQGAYTFVELASVYTDYCYKIGVHDGYEYALEEFENNRLKTCDNQTPQEAWRETEFVVPFVKEHHRLPTFSDAIEETRKQMIDKACKWIEYYNNNGGCLFDGWKDDFVKAMEK